MNQPAGSSPIGLNDIIAIRIGLQQMTAPSAEIVDAILHLDKVIGAICLGFVIPIQQSSILQP